MRCVVVGAGIVGICSALQLQREGHEVVVIDRNGPGEATSRGNAGIFAIGHVVPIGTPAILKRVPAMLLDSTSPLTIRPIVSRGHRAVADPPSGRQHAAPGRGDLARARGDPRAGSGELSAADQERRRDRSGAAARLADPVRIRSKPASGRTRRRCCAAAGASGVEELDEGTIRQLVPGLRPGPVWGVMLPDCEHTLDPYRLTVALAEDFVAQGGVIQRGDVRTGIAPDGKAQVMDGCGSARVRRAGDRGRLMVAQAHARPWR